MKLPLGQIPNISEELFFCTETSGSRAGGYFGSNSQCWMLERVFLVYLESTLYSHWETAQQSDLHKGFEVPDCTWQHFPSVPAGGREGIGGHGDRRPLG
jgi:hypothetical protein